MNEKKKKEGSNIQLQLTKIPHSISSQRADLFTRTISKWCAINGAASMGLQFLYTNAELEMLSYLKSCFLKF